MPATSQGLCLHCARPFERGAMATHLAKALAGAAQTAAGAGRLTRQLLLLVEGYGTYWLYVRASEADRLEHIDDLLRATWLECCGHMSVFHIGRERYARFPCPPDEDWGVRERSMKARLGDVLPGRRRFTYEYDYGSTTVLSLKLVREWDAPVAKPVPRPNVVAENHEPERRCEDCGAPATGICSQCYCTDDAGWLCDRCGADHDCGEDMLLPAVNSPRVGVCGYTGPAGRLLG